MQTTARCRFYFPRQSSDVIPDGYPGRSRIGEIVAETIEFGVRRRIDDVV